MAKKAALCCAIVFIYLSIWHMMKEFVELLFIIFFHSFFLFALCRASRIHFSRLDYVGGSAAAASTLIQEFARRWREMLT